MDSPNSQNYCADCGAPKSEGALTCPSCHSLTHASELEDLARKAQIALNGSNLTAARDFWAQALPLLPPETVQYRSVEARVAELNARLHPAASAQPGWKKGATAGLGPIALVLWKLKALLFGLTKIGTLLSMFVSFGFYWNLYGWPLAAGLILSIYIHEMGHVIELRKFGIPAGAPMFIPGLGAIIQLRGVALPPLEDARIGLAGPLYGLGAALLAFCIYAITGLKIWAAIANLGAVINLFNLIPIWQLDGARGFHSQNLAQRVILLILAGALWLVTKQGMLLLIVLGGVYRLFRKDASAEPDNVGFIQFAGLLVALTLIIVLVR